MENVIFIESAKYSVTLQFRSVIEWDVNTSSFIVLFFNVFLNGHWIMKIAPDRRESVEKQIRAMLVEFAL